MEENNEISAEWPEALLADAKTLLGSSYDGLRARHERGRQGPTRAKRPHRLMELIVAAEEAAASFRTASPASIPWRRSSFT